MTRAIWVFTLFYFVGCAEDGLTLDMDSGTRDAGIDGSLPLPCVSRDGTLSMSAFHACGVLRNRAVACWGSNFHGSSEPPAGLFDKVSAGHSHSCGLRADGTVTCWGGLNQAGELNAPIGKFVEVGAGQYRSSGIAEDGSLVIWGTGGAPNVLRVEGRFRKVSASWDICALDSEGEIKCVGLAFDGVRSAYELIDAGSWQGPYEHLSVSGDDRLCAVRTNGELECFDLHHADASVRLPGPFVRVSSSSSHTCAIDAQGHPYCFDPDGSVRDAGLNDAYAQIATGYKSTCGLLGDGALACPGLYASGSPVGGTVPPPTVPLLIECPTD